MFKIKNSQNKTDEELVSLTLKNQEYFLYLVERYKEKLFRYIRRISSFEKEEVEDILQDIFIKVYQNLNGFDLKLKFSSWIYRITHNQVISQYRKIKNKPKILSFDLNNHFLENISSDLNLNQEINLNDLKEEINQFLNQLDIKYREVLILKFMEEKDYREISDILKKPIGTIATLINRAKKKLKELIEKNEEKY